MITKMSWYAILGMIGFFLGTSTAQPKRKPPADCVTQGVVLAIDGLSEGFLTAQKRGDDPPSWEEIQKRLREARELALSGEWK